MSLDTAKNNCIIAEHTIYLYSHAVQNSLIKICTSIEKTTFFLREIALQLFWDNAFDPAGLIKWGNEPYSKI